MRLGVCVPVEQSALAKSIGYDFVEENIQSLLQGTVDDAQWSGAARVAAAALPVTAANCLVPGRLKITGPEADPEQLRQYMTRVLRRANQLNLRTLVFGSSAARNIPEDFDREQGRRQVTEFMRSSAQIAAEHNVVLVIEPLNRKESNIIITVAEAMTYVRAVNHPNFQCLVDSYHFWLDDNSLEDLAKAMPWIRHVHVADEIGRTLPGESGQADYRPFFHVLKEGGYDGNISIEANGTSEALPAAGPRALEYLRKHWQEA